MTRFLFTLILVLAAHSAVAGSTKEGVVYATGSGEIRRVIVPDDDRQLNLPNITGPGETLLVIDQTADITAAVTAAFGSAPPPPMAAAIASDGTVSKVIAADPAVDAVPAGATAFVPAYPGVAPGQNYDAKTQTFSSPIVITVIPKSTIDLITGKPSLADVTVTSGGPVAKPIKPVMVPPVSLSVVK